MNKKGFTLIELLAVLIIIMLLLTITVPLISSRMRESRVKATDTLVKNIEYATKKYVTDNIRDLDELNRFGFINITLKSLIDNKYIEENLMNPNTKKPLFLDDVVYVTLNYNNNISVIYDIDQSSKAKITLKGFFNDKVKLNTAYNDPGAIGTDGVSTNSDIKATSGSVNTSIEGVYELQYVYGNSRTITRNVIVTDDM